jgi:hypothetical protein
MTTKQLYGALTISGCAVPVAAFVSMIGIGEKSHFIMSISAAVAGVALAVSLIAIRGINRAKNNLISPPAPPVQATSPVTKTEIASAKIASVTKGEEVRYKGSGGIPITMS